LEQGQALIRVLSINIVEAHIHAAALLVFAHHPIRPDQLQADLTGLVVLHGLSMVPVGAAVPAKLPRCSIGFAMPSPFAVMPLCLNIAA
jgi:hypothetical protein